ncbi:MAG TPA: tail fiber protein [Geobacteraceae bacterium]
MSDPYLGEIRMFAGKYAPENWHFCDGALLQISAYDALFSLIGTTYGGDGTTTFGLPDLRGRLPIGQGQGVGSSAHNIGQNGGTESVTLTSAALPVHSHAAYAVNAAGNLTSPQKAAWASPVNTTTAPATLVNQYVLRAEVKAPAVFGTMDPLAIGKSGLGTPRPHGNVMPSLPLSFIIALNGEYPQRS